MKYCFHCGEIHYTTKNYCRPLCSIWGKGSEVEIELENELANEMANELANENNEVK